jgi:hypothetical protein
MEVQSKIFFHKFTFMRLLLQADIFRGLLEFLDFEDIRNVLPLNKDHNSFFNLYVPSRLKITPKSTIQTLDNLVAFVFLEILFDPQPDSVGNFVGFRSEFLKCIHFIYPHETRMQLMICRASKSDPIFHQEFVPKWINEEARLIPQFSIPRSLIVKVG